MMNEKTPKELFKDMWDKILGRGHSRPAEKPAIESEEAYDPEKSILHWSIQNVYYTVVLVVLFFWILMLFKFLFIALTLSVFSCFMLYPIINSIAENTKLNRTFISGFISLVFTIILVTGTLIVINNLIYFFSDLGLYEKQMDYIINDIIQKINNAISEIDNEILPGKIALPDVHFSIRDYLVNTVSMNFYLDSFSSFFTFSSGFLLIFIFVFFMLNEATNTSRKLQRILGDNEKTQNSIKKNIGNISDKITRYLLLKVVVSLATSLLVWVLLSVYNVENRMTWAFFTFAFNFIPNIGSIAITVLITLMSIIQFYPEWNAPLVIGLSTTLIQVLIGNILDPFLQGEQLDLSPLLILISLAFWGYLWGIIGMFLAVPMLEVVRITCNNIEGLRPVAIFISSGKEKKQERKERQEYKGSQGSQKDQNE